MSELDRSSQPGARREAKDVRMQGFTRRATVQQAWQWIDAQVASDRAADRASEESVPLDEAAGRVLRRDVVSHVNVPLFARSMMDGYAVRASDTQGASDESRLALRVVGQSLPANPSSQPVVAGTAVRIMTGAPMPAGADAVIPVERCELADQTLYVLDSILPGKHVGQPGEDVAAGTTILTAGRRLRPQDLGVLSSIGVGQVEVVARPRVRLVITGNELLPPGSRPQGHKIVDANSPMLAALVRRDGGEVCHSGLVPDRPTEILAALESDADVLLVSGGSSVGQEDYVPLLLSQHGELAIHGVAIRPSSPAGMGRLGERLVFLLPGNPVSCLCGYDFFAGRAIRRLAGLPADWPYVSRRLPLASKLVSAVGRVDYARVRVVDGQVEPLAIAGSSVLSSTTRATGFVVIPADSEGFPPATEVEVFFYE